MHNESKIPFIDPHTECIGCNDCIQFAPHELVLDQFALIWHQPRVISADADLQFFGNHLDQSFATFACGSIDDSATGSAFEKF